MNHSQLVIELVELSGLKASEVNRLIEKMGGLIASKNAGGVQVIVKKLGTFGFKNVAGKMTTNPRDQTSAYVNAYRKPNFKPSTFYKETVRG